MPEDRTQDTRLTRLFVAALVFSLALAGCGGTAVPVSEAFPHYAIGGSVSGLSGSGLVLQDNVGNDLRVAANGGFSFSNSIATGANYAVTVKTQPSAPAQICAVSNGSGTVTSANVNNVAINCAAASCIRIVRNLLAGNSGGWGQAGAPVGLPSGEATASFTGVGPASFTLNGSAAGFSLLGTTIYLAQNSSYALGATISNYTSNYPGTNFEILGATPGSFSGVTRLNFYGDGVYALLFTYTGESAWYLARIGVNVDAGPSTATGPAGFIASDLSLEQLPDSASAPGEYVTPGYAWAFNYANSNSYDSSTGIVQDAVGVACANSYHNVWAITADSFGASPYDFPNQLANNIAEDYVFFVDSVPGRKLSTAESNIDPLLSNTAQVQTDALLPSVVLPSTVALPNGIIVEGGVNDIVQDSAVSQLEAVTASIINDVESKHLGAILFTVSPFGNNVNWTTAREQVRIAYNQWVRGQASPQNQIYVYDMAAATSAGGIADDANPTNLAASFDIGDGLHPNAAGSLQIATTVKEILDTQAQ
jgi:lysophospholipase L1-like esterase